MLYVGHVKKEVAGLGVIHEVNEPKVGYDEYLPPPPPELLQDYNDQDPVYANIKQRPPSSPPPPPPQNMNEDNRLYHARPYNIDASEDSNKQGKLGMRVDSFSSSSSDASNPSASQVNPAPNRIKHNFTGSKPLQLGNETGFSSDEEKNLVQEALKNPTVPAGKKCSSCKEALSPGDVAISTERAGPTKVWHPRCFRCCECKVIKIIQ